MEKTRLTKTDLYQLLTGLFVGCLIISNVLASKTFEIFGIILPTAVIIFPIVYIINDVMAEIYGYIKAKRVILLGFIVNLLAVICYAIAIKLPAPIFAIEGAEAFAMVLGSSWRILLGSFTAYIIGSLVNAKIMDKMRKGKSLMARCVLSTFVGESLDAIIFITIAFVGTMNTSALITMIIAQALYKTIYEIIIYPVTKMIIKGVRNLDNGTMDPTINI